MRYTHPVDSEISSWSGTRAQFAISFASKAIRPADIQAITQIYMISPAHSTGCIMGCQLHPKSPSVNRWQIVCSCAPCMKTGDWKIYCGLNCIWQKC